MIRGERMKICNYQGNGVCINCKRVPPKGYGDICRSMAEEWLDCFVEIVNTKLTYEQKQLLEDFGIEVEEVEE